MFLYNLQIAYCYLLCKYSQINNGYTHSLYIYAICCSKILWILNAHV